jgi:hypothetical protein
MNLPYALGCPACRYYEVVSEIDPDASLSELYHHLFNKHADYSRVVTNQMLTDARELTAAEAADR